MKLKDDYLVACNNFSYNEHEFISIITTKGTGKRVRLNEFPISTRTRRGILLIREVKTNPYEILTTFIDDSRNFIGLKNGDINIIKNTELSIADRYSTGTSISKHNLTNAFIVATLRKENNHQEQLIEVEEEKKEIVEEKKIPKKEQISLSEIDDRLMTIDDFLK